MPNTKKRNVTSKHRNRFQTLKRKESLAEQLQRLWDQFLEKERKMPSRITIPADHIKDVEGYSQEPLKPDVNYFMVEVNEMFLHYESKLWVKLDPTVFVTTQFHYNGKNETVPFVVGPSMMGIPDDQVPKGMIFTNTKVAGYYPYKGGDLTLAVILCQVSRDDYAKKILKIVDAIAGALDYSTQIGSYLKLAGIVVDGVEEIMGIKGSTPLIGLRTEFRPPKLRQNFYALVNTPAGTVKNEDFWVINDKLYKGTRFANCKEYRDADYVLYSLKAATTRDVIDLPFYSSKKKIMQDASTAGDEFWERAKASMATLYSTMYDSPDLTTQHAVQLKDEYIAEMKKLHDSIPQFPKTKPSTLSAKEKKVLKETIRILDL